MRLIKPPCAKNCTGGFEDNKTKKHNNESTELAAKIVGTNRQYISDAETFCLYIYILIFSRQGLKRKFGSF
jgi:hypothetical protein